MGVFGNNNSTPEMYGNVVSATMPKPSMDAGGHARAGYAGHEREEGLRLRQVYGRDSEVHERIRGHRVNHDVFEMDLMPAQLCTSA